MKAMKRGVLTVISGVLVVGAAFLAGVVVQPRSVQKLWIHFSCRSRWEELNRLGQLLTLGMTPEEVEAFMGKPTHARETAKGISWSYYDGVSCAGENLVLFFRFATSPQFGNRPKLSYAHQDHEDHAFVPLQQYFTYGERP